MGTLVDYQLDGRVATITMDDGKVNALSRAMFADLGASLDRAEADGAVVILTGRPGTFSAGFDLAVLRAGGPDAAALLRAGFETSERLLSFRTPVVVACSGHAIAMGVFLLLSGDYRIGTSAPCKLVANEVAIGMTMPRAALEILQHRLTPAASDRAAILAEPFSPMNAVECGLLDRLVDASELQETARATAGQFATLDMAAHAATKLRARAAFLATLRAAIETDGAEFAAALAVRGSGGAG